MLRDHNTLQAEERLALGLGKGDLVFTRVNGQPISPDSLTSWVARVAKRAGTSHIMPVHGLRHRHITNLLRAQTCTPRSPPSARDTAGSASRWIGPATLIPSLQEDAALRIDAALRKSLAK